MPTAKARLPPKVYMEQYICLLAVKKRLLLHIFYARNDDTCIRSLLILLFAELCQHHEKGPDSRIKLKTGLCFYTKEAWTCYV